MLKTLWWIFAIYCVGFFPVLVLEIASGPVTPGLALLRAAVWPLYVPTGIPHGVRARPGDQYD